MTKREAAIVSAYTGFLLGSFSALHEYVEEIMGHPVWTHEFPSLGDKIRELSHEDYISIKVTNEPTS